MAEEINIARKPGGSDSRKKVLELAHRGMQLLAEYNPTLMGKTQAFMAEAVKAGVIS